MTVLEQLFQNWAHESLVQCLALGANGSNRQYFRLIGSSKQCIGTLNDDVRENDAFLYFSSAFAQRHIAVPLILAVSDDHRAYLQQDLGDTTFFTYCYDKKRSGTGFDREVFDLYSLVLSDLAVIQTRCSDVDFHFAYPRSDFDRQSLLWDFQYFKYYFLKIAHVPFDEQLLERDFDRFIDYLLSAHCDYFMYRDFQSRNIMLVAQDDGRLAPFYIDYQGGRRGAAQYDAASLLYSSKSDLPDAVRRALLDVYVAQLAAADLRLRGRVVDIQQFKQLFYAYALARIMQAFGAYGFRGFFERKDSFLKSVPLAIANLRILLDDHPLPISLPHLSDVLHHVASLSANPFAPITPLFSSLPADALTVTINSFSFKQGLPADPSGNGGGFVFDCRALPNPGRYPEYRPYTGRDISVIHFLQNQPAVDDFLNNAKTLVAQSIDMYIQRRFTSLSVSFGCTGGQHRSVFCAERLALFVQNNFSCNVLLIHRELNFSHFYSKKD